MRPLRGLLEAYWRPAGLAGLEAYCIARPAKENIPRISGNDLPTLPYLFTEQQLIACPMHD